MTLVEQAAARVALARAIGREPVRWVATSEIAAQMSDDSGHLHGVPIEEGEARWGLHLVLAPA